MQSDTHPPKGLDTIVLRGMHLSATFSGDAWSRPSKPQPVVISVSLSLAAIEAASTDDLKDTFSYSTIYKAITSSLATQSFHSLAHLTNHLSQKSASDWPGEALHIVALAPKAILRAEGGLSMEVCWKREPSTSRQTQPRRQLQQLQHQQSMEQHQAAAAAAANPQVSQHDHHQPWRMERHAWAIKGLRAACIIGVNAHERLEKQIVAVDVGFGRDDYDDDDDQRGDDGMCREVARRVCESGEASAFSTVEALAGHVARAVLGGFETVPWVKVRCEKPSALAFVDGAGVEITRYR